MKFRDFIKEKILYLSAMFICLIVIWTILNVIAADLYVTGLITVLILLPNIISMIVEFYKKSRYYNEIEENLEELDQKFLLSEIVERPDFLEGEILYDVMKEANKSMNDEISKYKRSSREYREYIEMWVHEIKTPIASSNLIFENNKNDITKSLSEEMNKIDGYVEQALYYAKSSSVEKDYIILGTSLKEIVNGVIRKNSKILIHKRIKIEIFEDDFIVYVDKKWMEFILNQIINNSIKYMDKDTKVLRLTAQNSENRVALTIEDNGIGMSEKDVSKAFEKGFTGENGRKFSKSTGIGLYLCKKLCDKLALGITIFSIEGKGTKVQIVFPKSGMMILK